MSLKRVINQIDKDNDQTYVDHEEIEKKELCNNDIMGLEHIDKNDDNYTIKNKLLNSGEPIRLNVGGTEYYTSLLTLTSNTNSILNKVFSGPWKLKPIKDGSYFFDRDGQLFKYILEFLRNNKVTQVDQNITLIDALIVEAEFFQLTSMKSELLIKKSGSSILKKGDAEFILKSFKKSFGESELCISFERLIYSGRYCYDYDKLHSINGLLFLFISEDDDRFGFYIHGTYAEYHQPDGFSFDLDSELTGDRCVRKKYMPGAEDCMRIEIEDSSDSVMFTATLMWIEENNSFLECRIKTISADAEELQCECKWIQSDNDRTVFNKSIKRVEIFTAAL